MARSQIATLHSHSICQATIAAATTKLLGIEEVGMDPQVADILNYAGGEYRPSYSATIQIEPIFDFTLSDIANALTLVDHQDGLGIDGGTDVLEVFFVQKEQVGTRMAGATHFKFGAKRALVYLEELTCEQGSHATARFRICAVYDGVNDIIIFSPLVALPAAIGVLSQKFKLGSWKINTVDVPGVTGMTYRTGIVVQADFAGGDHRPTFAHVKTIAPQIQLRTLEVPSYDTYGLEGTVGTALTTGYLYKIQKNGMQVADATAEHIKITCQADDHRIHMGRLAGRNNENATGEIIITPTYDGTNKVVDFNLASAVA